jgi:hypothetical protein
LAQLGYLFGLTKLFLDALYKQAQKITNQETAKVLLLGYFYSRMISYELPSIPLPDSLTVLGFNKKPL